MNSLKKKNLVLVVDDEPGVLKFLEIDLKLHGFEVITVTSGIEALQVVKSEEPDIMLLDIIMPGLSGLEVLRRLRTFSRLPVIAFSAGHSNYSEAIRMGADTFIAKPFNADDMVRRINDLITR